MAKSTKTTATPTTAAAETAKSEMLTATETFSAQRREVVVFPLCYNTYVTMSGSTRQKSKKQTDAEHEAAKNAVTTTRVASVILCREGTVDGREVYSLFDEARLNFVPADGNTLETSSHMFAKGDSQQAINLATFNNRALDAARKEKLGELIGALEIPEGDETLAGLSNVSPEMLNAMYALMQQATAEVK